MYYHSYSGYNDELAWAAAWLYQATNSPTYMIYLLTNDVALKVSGRQVTEFSWDDKTAGAQLLMAKVSVMTGR